MSAQPSRLFALIPAAGHSRRMGQPKLLLPLGASTIIARLLSILDRPDIAQRLVVVRRDDEPLRTAVAAGGATILQPPVDPPDMRHSVQWGLDEIRRLHAPAPRDGWILIPADHPLLVSSVLDALIAEWEKSAPQILVPTYQGRRGHPTFFRWELADAVRALPGDCGLNRLLHDRAAEVREVPVENRAVICDLDTPGDYDELLEHAGDAPA